MLYFSHHVLHSGWSYKYFCDFTIFVASGTHLTVTECLSVAFFGYHVSMHCSCIYLTCIHLANSYQPVWLYNVFLSFLLLLLLEISFWITEWYIERFPTKFQPHKSKVLDCKNSLTILHLQFKYNSHMDLLRIGTQFDWKIICGKQWRIEWTTRWSLLKSGHKLTFSFADSEWKSQVPIIFWQSSCCILLISQPIT
jgi:hypothetical protein